MLGDVAGLIVATYILATLAKWALAALGTALAVGGVIALARLLR